MSHFNAKQLFSVLKDILKSKKISYKELSKSISFSESTLKNMFHDNNVSIERMIEICNAIDISFPDLVNLANNSIGNDFSFTFEQEKFFAQNPHYYYFFREIFFEKKSLEVVKEQFKLTDKSIMKYIMELEKIKLLEVHPNNRLKFLVYGKLIWSNDGPWMQKFYPKFINKMVDLQLSNLNNDNYYTSFPSFFTVSHKTYENFKNDVRDIARKYKEMAFRDSLMNHNEDFVPVTWSFSMVPEDLFAIETQIPNL